MGKPDSNLALAQRYLYAILLRSDASPLFFVDSARVSRVKLLLKGRPWLGSWVFDFSMIEAPRYALALLVAWTHLWSSPIGWVGWQSVFAFYTLSGYLMTRVLQERCGFSLLGMRAFAINRVLRLYPAYLIVAGGTLLVTFVLPLQNYVPTTRMPRNLLEWITSVTVIGQVGFDFGWGVDHTKLATTSWSLSIELVCYALLAIYFAASSKRLIAFAILGLILCAASSAYCASTGLDIYGPYCGQNRYGVLQAGFIPFAIGGLVYLHKDAVAAWVRRRAVYLTIVLVLCELASYFSEFFRLVFSPFIGSVGIAAFIAVTTIKKDLRADFIGRASYHLFIAHMSVVSIIGIAGLTAFSGPVTFVVTTALCLLLSAALVPMERSIEITRRRIAAEARTAARFAEAA
jgi:peptidoglycan/LPS O-acetylase OafA/YrhL